MTEQPLERAHWELERADEKANTLFRLYGVILAAGVAFSVTGNSKSLNTAAGSILLVAAIFGSTAGGLLAFAPRPSSPFAQNGRHTAPAYCCQQASSVSTPHRYRSASFSALMQRFRATLVADGRDQIAHVLERSVRRSDLPDASRAGSAAPSAR